MKKESKEFLNKEKKCQYKRIREKSIKDTHIQWWLI